MPLLEIITPENPVLRQKTRPVTVFDADLQQLINDMIDTMRDAPGVGLAAPQIGVPLRLCVIETLEAEDEEGNIIPDSRELFVLVNPEIVWESRHVVTGIEGCLSLPGYLGEVERYEKIRVRAQDRFGKKVRIKVSDWDARIFQHEIDHLDGVLYIDKLTDRENFWTEAQYQEMMDALYAEDAEADSDEPAEDDS